VPLTCKITPFSDCTPDLFDREKEGPVRPHDQLVSIRPSSRSLLSDPAEDILDLEVLDRAGQRIGLIEELLVDLRERRVRLLRVRLAGRQRDAGVTRLIPVDAVWRITDRDLSIDRVRAHVDAGPAGVGGEPDQRDLERIYAHYGYYPYWVPGYLYPSYPVYP
jgi:hypothetical protein